MSKIMHMDTQYAGITPERDFSELIDFFYPIGCYFETSDDSFDPNVSWGGAWILEEEGNVHVSSGDHYLAGEDGGSTTSTVPTTKLTDAQMAHGHGFTQPTVNGGTCNITSSGGHDHVVKSRYVKTAGGTASWQMSILSGGTGATVSSDVNVTIDANTGTHTHSVPNHTHTVSNGAVSNLSGASSTRTAHGHGSVSTMQPYIVVNRWHRIG